MFKQLWGRDISYRRRQRYCRSCQNNFDTAEIDAKFLTYLVEEMDHLRNTARRHSNYLPYYNEGPGAIALLCSVFPSDEAPDEQRCLQALPEIVDIVREVVATLPSDAQMLVGNRYRVSIGGVAGTKSNAVDELHFEDVFRMLRHPSRARRLRPLLYKLRARSEVSET